jgi:hypothetical protein
VPAHVRRVPSVAIVTLAVMAVAIAGCSRISSPREWMSTAQQVSGGTVTFAVRDESGRIDDVEIDPAGVAVAEPVSNPADRPNVLLVSWVGGACDRRTDIGVAGDGQGLEITIQTSASAGDCDAIGVGHIVRLTSSQPLPAAGVRVRTQPPSVG